jgi:hypothetical protein
MTDPNSSGEPVDALTRLLVQDTGQRIRRAVLTEQGTVADKTTYPSLQEVPVLSEICALLFANTEPRHAPELLRRAFKYGIASAWQAVYDDITCNLYIDAAEYTEDFMKHLIEACSIAQPTRLFCICHFAIQHDWPPMDYELFQGHTALVDDFVRAVVSLVVACPVLPTLLDYLQTIMRRICPPIETVYQYMKDQPGSCVLFLQHPDLGHLIMKQDLGNHLCAYAETRRPEERNHILTCIAKLVQMGLPICTNIGKETLMALSSRRFDINVAAAAAVIAREEPDPTVQQLARLIETLAATIAATHKHVGGVITSSCTG